MTILTYTTYKFVSDVVHVDWHGETRKMAVISVEKKYFIEGREVKLRSIHPLTEFILEHLYDKQFNTQKKYASNIVVFLNHLSDNGIHHLNTITFSIGASFLNTLSSDRKLSKQTIVKYERSLVRFYYYLTAKGLLDTIETYHFERIQGKYGEFFKTPFKGILYPKIKKKKIEHNFPVNYIPLLLELSILVTPDITLGIYLSIFGGLRIGEIVNLSKTQVQRRIKSGDFLLDIKDRHFRQDIKDGSSSNVKKPRFQEVFNINEWLPLLFSDHIERYHPTDGSNALFVNSHGKAMTAKTYSYRFKKLKKKFCEYLVLYGTNDDRLLAEYLQSVEWSTHIGRGTFTNLLAEMTDNPLTLSYYRGDSRLESSLPYMVKQEKTRKKIEQRFTNMNATYLPRMIQKKESRSGDFDE